MFFSFKGAKAHLFYVLKGRIEKSYEEFQKSTGKILLASGLVVSMSACSVTNLFGEKKNKC